MKIFVFLWFGCFSVLCSSALKTDYSDAASRFWQMDSSAQTLMHDTVTLVAKIPESGLIPPALEPEITLLIRRFYDLKTELKSFSSSNSRQFLLSLFLPGHNSEEVYAADIRGFKADDSQYLETLFGCLSDLLVYEVLRFFYHVLDNRSELKDKWEELEIDNQTHHFTRLGAEWLSRQGRARFAKSLILLQSNQSTGNALIAGGALYLTALLDRLDTPLAQETIKSSSFWGQVSTAFQEFLFALKIRKGKWLNWAEYNLSKLFGNIAGSINIQDLLKSIPESELKSVHQNLKPGDILVEKTAGAITDSIIPGHFGHVAMVIGNINQLSDLKFANGDHLIKHQEIVKLLPQIESGKTVLEAIRPGIRLHDIRDWKITDLAILRPKNSNNLAETILKAIRYNNTRYDFAFDVNTSSIVVCSELPYQSYQGMRFRTKKTAGRHTITPDDIAVMAGTEAFRPLELIRFYHNTKEISESKMLPLYIRLVDKDSQYWNYP
ncbi:MAG: hypothetical protein H3C47_01380 [Candidatus Cloacimonetes bacterium]|nr:hypothetical protein [Candidatus Cloacimonadota bacterium]